MGISEVPLDSGIKPQTRRLLSDMRQRLAKLRLTQAPPSAPTNLQVTAQAFANLVQWTRAQNADYYEVLWSTTANLNNSNAVNVGDSAQWTDPVGQSAITRFYWVRSRKNRSDLRSIETGPKSGTTLASGTGVAPPTPPPAGQNIVKNQQTGRNEPLR